MNKTTMVALVVAAMCGPVLAAAGSASDPELPCPGCTSVQPASPLRAKPSSPLIDPKAWAALVGTSATSDPLVATLASAAPVRAASGAVAQAAGKLKTGVNPGKPQELRTAKVEASRGGDARIRVERYDPDRVVKIFTAVGNPTLIQFEEDERIVGTPGGMIGMGDAKAWSVGPKGSNIMLKPKSERPDTILLVVTTKRTYAFEISSVTKKSNIEPTLIVRFDYPDTKAKANQAEVRKQERVSDRLQQIAGNHATPGTRNRSYMKRGDQSLVPSQVEDDGRFTFMRFDSTRELPVVYKILPDGTEALTNFHMDSDTGTMVIHEVAAQFVLRYGKSVLAIRNDGFNPDGQLNLTGTTVPNTVRLQKDAL